MLYNDSFLLAYMFPTFPTYPTYIAVWSHSLLKTFQAMQTTGFLDLNGRLVLLKLLIAYCLDNFKTLQLITLLGPQIMVLRVWLLEAVLLTSYMAFIT